MLPRFRCCLSVGLTWAVLFGSSGRGAEPEQPATTPSPSILRRPIGEPPAVEAESARPDPYGFQPIFAEPFDPPLGYAGPSGILPRENQETAHFVPVEDRWRLGFPDWNRAETPVKKDEDRPYMIGHWWDPYNQNVLKGDYPILGQHTFLNLTAFTRAIMEGRQVPTPANGFDSTARPFEEQAFGRPNQFFYTQYFGFAVDLFHGDAGYKPVDWRVKFTPIFNVNQLDVEELGVVSPDVRKGTTRGRTWTALEDWFLEAKLLDLSPDYDFLSARVGSQPFISDFRGFLFSDTNRAVRLFGTQFSNRDQFNLIYFRQLEKDTNSFLNTFHDRHQNIVMANYFHQDCLFPGYTVEGIFAYNNDQPTFIFDKNGFLVRPDPVGVAKPHELNVFYLGWGGNGHIERFNLTHFFYWALGHDTLNPLANQEQDINAQMFAAELSYDRDWARFRTSFFWASGDRNISNSHATGFDAIIDNPNFAGGEFSYWQRQQIKLLGVNLVQRESLLPDLRSSKFQGQSNFVNPGLFLYNLGVDFDLTPKLKMVNNLNFLWFAETEVLKQFVFQDKLSDWIGADLSVGFEYRPLLNNNVMVTFGVSSLLPGEGFKDIYNNSNGSVSPLVAGFLDLKLTY